MQHPEASAPAEAIGATDFVGEAEDAGTVGGIRRKQGRLRGEPLGQQDDLVPTAAGRLVIQDGHRGIAQPGPLEQFVVRLARVLTDRDELDAFRSEGRLGSLAPRPGDPRRQDEPQTRLPSRLLDFQIFHRATSSDVAAPER